MTQPQNKKVKMCADMFSPNLLQGIMPIPIARLWNISIRNDIGPAYLYEQELDIIENASEADTIHIKLNTCGGSLATAIDFMNAMQKSKAHIITEAVGECSSAGTVILFCGKEIRLGKHTTYLFHNAKFGLGGEAQHIYDEAVFMQDYLREFITDIYEGFFSEVEFEGLIRGDQVFLSSKQVGERLEKRNALRKEAQVAELKACGCEDCAIQLATMGIMPEDDAIPTKEEISKWSKKELLDFVLGAFYPEDEVETVPEEEVEEPQLGWVSKDNLWHELVGEYRLTATTDNFTVTFDESATTVTKLATDVSVSWISSLNKEDLSLLALELGIKVLKKDAKDSLIDKIDKRMDMVWCEFTE